MARLLTLFLTLGVSLVVFCRTSLAFDVGYGVQLRWGNIVDYSSVKIEGERVAIAWTRFDEDPLVRDPHSPRISNLIVDSLMGPFNTEFDPTSRARFPIKLSLPASKYGSFGLEWLWDYEKADIFLMRDMYALGGPPSYQAQCPGNSSYNYILGPHCLLSVDLSQERIQFGLMLTYTFFNSDFIEAVTFGIGRSFGQVSYDLDIRICYGDDLYSFMPEDYYKTLQACHDTNSGTFQAALPGNSSGTAVLKDHDSSSKRVAFTHYSLTLFRIKGESWVASIFEMEFFFSDPIPVGSQNDINLIIAQAVSNYFAYTYLF